MDAKYHGWAAGEPLSEWAANSLIVRLQPT
jgi:hypothetical protein